eukprot:5596574-Ditylum_brightwellii.AAC.1
MTTTEDNFTIIPPNYLPLGNLDNIHLKNMFAEELETLPEEQKLAFLAKEQTAVDCHLREVKQKANDSTQAIFTEAIMKQKPNIMTRQSILGAIQGICKAFSFACTRCGRVITTCKNTPIKNLIQRLKKYTKCNSKAEEVYKKFGNLPPADKPTSNKVVEKRKAGEWNAYFIKWVSKKENRTIQEAFDITRASEWNIKNKNDYITVY